MAGNKNEIVIAEGKFKVGEGWDYTMPYTEKVDEDEMEDRLVALNGQEGELVFRRKKS